MCLCACNSKPDMQWRESLGRCQASLLVSDLLGWPVNECLGSFECKLRHFQLQNLSRGMYNMLPCSAVYSNMKPCMILLPGGFWCEAISLCMLLQIQRTMPCKGMKPASLQACRGLQCYLKAVMMAYQPVGNIEALCCKYPLQVRVLQIVLMHQCIVVLMHW